ncbi:MAG TPA: hypothetical protein VFY71_16860 [Planctomycetota bacterium]|nr:hypothetical protein [Planctomycetota bacterium]
MPALPACALGLLATLPAAAQLSLPDLAVRMESARGTLAPAEARADAAAPDLELTGRIDAATGSFAMRILIRRAPFAWREELTWHGAPAPAGGEAAAPSAAAELPPPLGHAQHTVFLSDGKRCWNLADEIGPAGPVGGLAAIELLDTVNLFRLLLDPAATLAGVADRPRLVTDELHHAVDEPHVDLFFAWPHGTAWVASVLLHSGRLVNLADSTGVTRRWFRALEWRPLGDGLLLPTRLETGAGEQVLSVLRLEAARGGLRHADALFAGDPAPPLPERLDATRLLVTGQPVPGAAAFIFPDVAVHGAASAGAVWTAFDTGSPEVYVHPELADKVGLLTVGAYTSFGVVGQSSSRLRWIDRLDLGRYSLLQLPAPDPPLPPFNELPAGHPLGAIVGGPRLLELSPVLDLRAGRLLLRGPPVRPLSELAGRPAAQVPLSLDDDRHLQLEAIVGGVPVRAVLDTGLPFALRLARADLPRLGLPDDDDVWRARGAVPWRSTSVGGHAGDDLLVRLDGDVSLGWVALRQPWVVIAGRGSEGAVALPTLVGAGALSALEQVGLDGSRMLLELLPPEALPAAKGGAPPAFVVPSPGRFLGFILNSPDLGAGSLPHDCPHVISVVAGTPAAAAGLREGDMLAQAGGADCEAQAPMDLWPRLHALPAGPIELRVWRKAVAEEVVLRIEP